VADDSDMAHQSTPTSHRPAHDRPTRSTARDLTHAAADAVTDELRLPSLDAGVTLLDVDGGRGVQIVQSLVLDHLLLHDGPAIWVDADGYAATTTLSRIAPSQRLLDRIRVARGFTAAQHYGAVCDLPSAVNRSIRASTAGAGARRRGSTDRDGDASPHTPALVVAPAVDAQYRADDALGEAHAATLQARALARLSTYADGYDVPVLVTRSECDAFTAPVATAADHHLTCEQTRIGPRFVGDDFETLVYPVDGGASHQTTFAYWRQVLAARAAQAGVEPTTPASSTATPEGVGTGVTADGETVGATADPLLDAWTATEAGGR
jgi:hypothetical protein